MKRPTWLKILVFFSVALAAVGISGVIAFLVVVLPHREAAPLARKINHYKKSPKPDPEKLATLEKGRIDTENAIRASVIQGLGGMAVLVGIYFAYQNLKAAQRNVLIAEDKQVTERFSKAVEMLGNKDNLHTRLGGLYALERIANDSDKDYWQVMEVLTAFVREESPWPPKQASSEGVASVAEIPDLVETPNLVESLGQVQVAAVENESGQSVAPQALSGLEYVLQEQQKREEFFATLPPLRTDIQAVMTVIGRRKHRFGKGEWETRQLILQKTDLRQLQAYQANLTGIVLIGAHLEGANLVEAHLEEAVLNQAHMERAFLSGSHLERASLNQTHLEEATLSEAHLKGAKMPGVYLRRTLLHGADLSQVWGLTQEALDIASINECTNLPDNLCPYLQSSQSEKPLPSTTLPPATPEVPPTTSVEQTLGPTPEAKETET